MFDRIKALFAETGNAETARSPARADLATTLGDIERAHEVCKGIEERISDLKSVIDEHGAAERERKAMVAGPSGATGLAAFVSGQEKGPLPRQFDRETRLARAANAARDALPVAERELADAGKEIARLQERKKKQTIAILIECGDLIGRRYAELFRELGEIHDQLIGFGRGCEVFGRSVLLASEAIEVPRFDLPSLPPGQVYSTFLRHVPAAQTVAAAALAWSRFAVQLAKDPDASVAGVLSPDLLNEVGRHPEHGGTIRSRIRPSRDNEPEVVGGIVVKKEEEKVRRVVKIA